MARERGVDVGALSGGAATTRMPETEADKLRRAELAADAARYLIRTGNRDLLPVLGLDGLGRSEPKRRVRKKVTR